MAVRKDRLGEVRVMNCGLKAKIIAYRGNKDMDVMFEDGTIRYNVSYRSFENGSLTNDKSNVNKSRLGEVRMMKCGEKAKVIAYRSSMDIDVMFEDGTIIRNRTYGNFVKGAIAKEGRILRNRIGEERIMNCGKKARIIDYRLGRDIDVMFEDGTKVTNVTYANFVRGNITHPNKHINEERMMKCGEKARIIRHGSSKDIDVMFADGTVRKNVSMQSFRDGPISKVPRATSEEIKSRLGEVRMMSCGLKGKIIRYNTSKDIDVELEDGTIRTHRTYKQFIDGAISNKKRESRKISTKIGGSIKLNCGFYAKLLDKNGHICKIEYEDGDIVERPQEAVNQSPFWVRGLKFTKVYTLNGVNFYIMKCRNKKYLGTVKEIKEQLEAHREERKNE